MLIAINSIKQVCFIICKILREPVQQKKYVILAFKFSLMGLDTVDLLVTIEKRFLIDIPNREASGIYTVGDIHRIAWNHLQARNDTSFGDLQQVSETINTIIADFAGVDIEEVTPEKSITGDLGLD